LNDGLFQGDRIEVKHSNEYEAANPNRVDNGVANSNDGEAYSDEGTECSQPA
jgi:hypothetical protein